LLAQVEVEANVRKSELPSNGTQLVLYRQTGDAGRNNNQDGREKSSHSSFPEKTTAANAV
jgi:hypothetical protein